MRVRRIAAMAGPFANSEDKPCHLPTNFGDPSLASPLPWGGGGQALLIDRQQQQQSAVAGHEGL